MIFSAAASGGDETTGLAQRASRSGVDWKGGQSGDVVGR